MIGAGKYDALATLVRHHSRASGVLLVVLGGKKGDGFSCQADAYTTARIPEMLDTISKQIRGDVAELSGAAPVTATDDPIELLAELSSYMRANYRGDNVFVQKLLERCDAVTKVKAV